MEIKIIMCKTSNGHKCINCGRSITWRFAICTDCEKIFGRKARDWPKWLRFLWNDEQRRRRKERKLTVNEIVFTDIEDSWNNGTE